MLTALPLYGIIYYSILNWIVSGTYRAGDKLPSRAELSLRFEASEDTVRKALAALLEQGYITMRRGSTPVVRFDPRDPAQRSWISERFESRRGTVLDLLNAYRFVLPPFLHRAIASLNRTETVALFRAIRASLPLDPDAFIQASCEIMERVLRHNENDNVSYFYSTSQLFLRLTMEGADCVAAQKDELIAMRKKLFRWLANRLLLFLKEDQRLTRRHVSAGIIWYINAVVRLLKLDTSPRGGNDTIYCNTQPKYMSICMDLIERMYAGHFGVGSFLPSDAAVAAEYRVAPPTARKAYKVLNRLEFARTVPKVGTQAIFTARAGGEWRPDPQCAPIYLRAFLDCLWFWKIAIHSTALAACLDVEPLAAELSALEKRCEASPPAFQVYYLLSLLDRTVGHTGNATLYSFFQLNKPLLFFGLHPLHLCRPEICASLCGEAHEALRALSSGEAQPFSAKLACVLEQLFDEAQLFYENALEPEQQSLQHALGTIDPEVELSYIAFRKTDPFDSGKMRKNL